MLKSRCIPSKIRKIGIKLKLVSCRWFLLRKWIQVSQTVVLVIDDLSVNDIEKHKEEFSESIKIFDYGFEVNNPKNEGLSIAQILAFSPVTNVVKHNIASGANYSIKILNS